MQANARSPVTARAVQSPRVVMFEVTKLPTVVLTATLPPVDRPKRAPIDEYVLATLVASGLANTSVRRAKPQMH